MVGGGGRPPNKLLLSPRHSERRTDLRPTQPGVMEYRVQSHGTGCWGSHMVQGSGWHALGGSHGTRFWGSHTVHGSEWVPDPVMSPWAEREPCCRMGRYGVVLLVGMECGTGGKVRAIRPNGGARREPIERWRHVPGEIRSWEIGPRSGTMWLEGMVVPAASCGLEGSRSCERCDKKMGRADQTRRRISPCLSVGHSIRSRCSEGAKRAPYRKETREECGQEKETQRCETGRGTGQEKRLR